MNLLRTVALETKSTWGRYEALVDVLGHDRVCDELARWMDSTYLKEAIESIMVDYDVTDEELEGY